MLTRSNNGFRTGFPKGTPTFQDNDYRLTTLVFRHDRRTTVPSRSKSTVRLCLLLTITISLAAVRQSFSVEPTPIDEPFVDSDLIAARRIRKIVADGKHNAFTALVRWQNEFWLAFRKATDHGSMDGTITLLRSPDAETWREALSLDVLADDRDPQLLVTPSRLFLYSLNWTDNRQRLQSYVNFTDDGETWSDPQPAYDVEYFLWKPTTHEGRFYAGAHRRGSIEKRGTHLITSSDAIHWDYVATIREGRGESETTLLFQPAARLIAFVRNMTDLQGSIMESSPPYVEWSERSAGFHLSGHSVHQFKGVTYVMSRHLDERATTGRSVGGLSAGTMIYTYDQGILQPYCLLPGRYDCSYTGAVQVGDEMLISFYSSHTYPNWEEKNGPADIFLAWVPLKE